MTTSSKTPEVLVARGSHRDRRAAGPAIPAALVRAGVLAAVVAVAGVAVAVLVWFGRRASVDMSNPVLALVDPTPSGFTAGLRVILLLATALTAGIGLVRALLGLAQRPGGFPWRWVGPLALAGVGSPDETAKPDSPVSGGVRGAAWVAGIGAAAACAVEVATGQASRPVGAAQLAVSLLVPLLLGSAGAVAPVAVSMAGLLAVELASGRVGLPWALDVVYALAGAVLLGASVFAVSHPGALRGVAILGGLVTSVAGVTQLALTGPGSGYDLLHTSYGIAALAQAALPVLVTAVWFRAGVSAQTAASERGVDSPERHCPATASRDSVGHATWGALGVSPGAERGRGEWYRLAAGAVALAFGAAATLATLPHPPGVPVPGQPLLRPVDLPLRHLAVLVLPMRPGPNLVHISGTESGSPPLRPGHHHGGAPVVPNGITVSVDTPGDAKPVPLATRPGATGGWAVVDIPPGADRLTVTADGVPVTVPVKVGTAPTDSGEQRLLAGPDGPECASSVLGSLLAAAAIATPDSAPTMSTEKSTSLRRNPAETGPVRPASAETELSRPATTRLGPTRPASDRDGCPAARLTGADADALRDTVAFLAERHISAINLVGDDSPRGLAAAGLVRAEAARHHLPVTARPTSGGTLLVVSGWSGAAEALNEASTRAVSETVGGVVLAPWLLTSAVLGAASSEVLPLRFNPQDTPARRYAATVAAAFPGEGPSAAGYLGWAATTGIQLDARSSFYGAAPVDVPMGMDAMGGMDAMNPGGDRPAEWYPGGTVVPINPPLPGPSSESSGTTP